MSGASVCATSHLSHYCHAREVDSTDVKWAEFRYHVMTWSARPFVYMLLQSMCYVTLYPANMSVWNFFYGTTEQFDTRSPISRIWGLVYRHLVGPFDGDQPLELPLLTQATRDTERRLTQIHDSWRRVSGLGCVEYWGFSNLVATFRLCDFGKGLVALIKFSHKALCVCWR
jgi:hypothetical protein